MTPNDVDKLSAFQKWRMCGRKHRYQIRKNANKSAKKRGIYYYECPICWGFHLTKKEPAETGRSAQHAL